MDQEEKQGAELINPYRQEGAKGEQVQEMFDSIAPAYDFMNTAMTFGLHRWWRTRAINQALRRKRNPGRILDVATGTGDVAFYLHSRLPEAAIEGIDLSEGMLQIAKRKQEQLPAAERGKLNFRAGDCLALPYDDNEFDMVTVAYGVRNFEHLAAGYREMLRVLRPGGLLCVIELAVPASKSVRGAYNLYSRHIIPAIGKAVSGDSRAYSYLPESIAAAPQRDDMTAIMSQAGFADCRWFTLTFGTVACYFAFKPVK